MKILHLVIVAFLLVSVLGLRGDVAASSLSTASLSVIDTVWTVGSEITTCSIPMTSSTGCHITLDTGVYYGTQFVYIEVQGTASSSSGGAGYRRVDMSMDGSSWSVGVLNADKYTFGETCTENCGSGIEQRNHAAVLRADSDHDFYVRYRGYEDYTSGALTLIVHQVSYQSCTPPSSARLSTLGGHSVGAVLGVYAVGGHADGVSFELPSGDYWYFEVASDCRAWTLDDGSGNHVKYHRIDSRHEGGSWTDGIVSASTSDGSYNPDGGGDSHMYAYISSLSSGTVDIRSKASVVSGNDWGGGQIYVLVACAGTCDVATSTPTATASLTPTATVTPTATTAYFGGCVEPTATIAASSTSTPFLSTPLATSTPNLTATVTPTSFSVSLPVVDFLPSDTVVEAFTEGLGSWGVNAGSVWVDDVGHNAVGAARVGSFWVGSAFLVHGGFTAVSHYVSGWVYLDDSFPVSTAVLSLYTLSAGEWIGLDGQGVILTVARDGGEWRRFTLNVGHSGEFYMLSSSVPSSGVDPANYLLVDDLQIGSTVIPSEVDICGVGAVSTLSALSTSEALDFSGQVDNDFVEFAYTVEDDPETNPCLGWFAFELDTTIVGGSLDTTIPGVWLCFARYSITTLRVGVLDLLIVFNAVTFFLVVVAIIDAVRTARK